MIVITLGILAVVAFVVLTEQARRGSTVAAGTATVEGAVLICAGVAAAIYALFAALFPCGGENCDVGSGDWWQTTDAWQWPAEAGVALCGLTALVVALVSLLRKRHRSASTWMLVAAVCFGVWAAFVAPFGHALGI